MSQLIGVRNTNQAITNESQRIIRDVDADIADLEPNQGALVTFLMKLDKRKPVKSPRIEWYEQDYVARWTTLAEDIDGSETGFDVADGTLFVAGDLLIRPVAASSSTVPDVDRVVSVSGNTITVVRGGTQTSSNGDAIRIIGTAYEENATQPESKLFAPVAKISYTEIFRTTNKISGTAAASEHYGSEDSNERNRELAKKLVEHKVKMNGSFLFGKASESLTGGPTSQPIRTTMGLNSVVATNLYDAGGVFTKRGMEEFARMSFRYGSDRKILLASPKVISAIHEWGNAFMKLEVGATAFGVDITKVYSGHGTWVLVKDWMMENGAGSTLNGFDGWAWSVDMESLEYDYLRGRDTKLIKDEIDSAMNAGRDGAVDEYRTEAGLKIKVEKRFAKLYNAGDYES